MFFRYFLSHRCDLEIVVMKIHVLLHLVGLGAFGWPFPAFALAIALEKSTRERAPGNNSDALIHAEWNHLAFLLAVDQVVMILHRDEPMPVMFLCQIKRLGKLPGRHATGAQVTDFSSAHETVEGIESFFDWGRKIPTMDLIKVDIVGIQPTQ